MSTQYYNYLTLWKSLGIYWANTSKHMGRGGGVDPGWELRGFQLRFFLLPWKLLFKIDAMPYCAISTFKHCWAIMAYQICCIGIRPNLESLPNCLPTCHDRNIIIKVLMMFYLCFAVGICVKFLHDYDRCSSGQCQEKLFSSSFELILFFYLWVLSWYSHSVQETGFCLARLNPAH